MWPVPYRHEGQHASPGTHPITSGICFCCAISLIITQDAQAKAVALYGEYEAALPLNEGMEPSERGHGDPLLLVSREPSSHVCDHMSATA